jgi:hypothetical protein
MHPLLHPLCFLALDKEIAHDSGVSEEEIGENKQQPSDSTEREFPTYWTPAMDGIAREYDFNLTLRWLGSLMVAYNHLQHRLCQAVSYLINEQDFQRGDATLGYMRQFKTLLDLFEELFALKVTDPHARKELKLLRKEIEKHTDTRNAFAHSRLLMPAKKREGVALRIKADDMSNKVHPVRLDELITTVEAIDACEHRLSAFCDTHLPSYREARFSALFKKIFNGSISLE